MAKSKGQEVIYLSSIGDLALGQHGCATFEAGTIVSLGIYPH